MYSNSGYDQGRQDALTNGRTEAEQRDMELAFERALADARSESTVTHVPTEQNDDEEIEEIIRDPKGDFDAVWESLRPEAERLGKLAEWERDFSQVSGSAIVQLFPAKCLGGPPLTGFWQFVSDEDDLFETLNDSLNRDDVGQADLGDQLGFGTGQYGNGLDGYLESEDGLPRARTYDFGKPSERIDCWPAHRFSFAEPLRHP